MVERLRPYAEQWRNAYVLLMLMLGFVWWLGERLHPNLQNIRVLGGLHSYDVLWLMDVLRGLRLLLLVCVLLFALSFHFKLLNTASAAAVTALCSSASLALLVGVALVVVGIRY